MELKKLLNEVKDYVTPEDLIQDGESSFDWAVRTLKSRADSYKNNSDGKELLYQAVSVGEVAKKHTDDDIALKIMIDFLRPYNYHHLIGK